MSLKQVGLARVLACSVVVVASALAAPAGAAGASKRQCAQYFEDAQEERRRGKLVRARELLLACSQNSCGEVMTQACTALLDEVASQIPSVVCSLADARGAISRADVTVDGELLTSRLDGRALSVDPGLHLIRMTTPDGRHAERRLLVVQGRSNQEVSFRLAPEASDTGVAAPEGKPPATLPPPAAETSRTAADSRSTGSRVLPYFFGALGATGIGGFAFLAYAGGRQERRLQECWPRCDGARVQRVRNVYWAANVSLGVGIAAAATGLVLVLRQPPARHGPRRSAASQPVAYSFELRPSLDGVSAGVSGSF